MTVEPQFTIVEALLDQPDIAYNGSNRLAIEEIFSLPHTPILATFHHSEESILYVIMKKAIRLWMSKLNLLFTTKNTLCWQMHHKWGNNVLKVCPSQMRFDLNNWIMMSLSTSLIEANFPRCRLIHNNNSNTISTIINWLIVP